MMGTSPPKQNAVLSVTLSARMVATAASAALPPALRRVRPASIASWPPAATAPFFPAAFQVPIFVVWAGASQTEKLSAIANRTDVTTDPRAFDMNDSRQEFAGTLRLFCSEHFE